MNKLKKYTISMSNTRVILKETFDESFSPSLSGHRASSELSPQSLRELHLSRMSMHRRLSHLNSRGPHSAVSRYRIFVNEQGNAIFCSK